LSRPIDFLICKVGTPRAAFLDDWFGPVRTEQGVAVECLKCGHVGFLSPQSIVASGDCARHAYPGIRQTPPLSALRKSERARKSQTRVAKGVEMCGRFAVKMTWAEIVALYRLTLDRPPHNLPPRHNVCPTNPIDVVTEHDGEPDFVRMRWGLCRGGGRSH
jgi:hypothetical protein